MRLSLLRTLLLTFEMISGSWAISTVCFLTIAMLQWCERGSGIAMFWRTSLERERQDYEQESTRRVFRMAGDLDWSCEAERGLTRER